MEAASLLVADPPMEGWAEADPAWLTAQLLQTDRLFAAVSKRQFDFFCLCSMLQQLERSSHRLFFRDTESLG
jgi:hypothetical protein